LLSTSPAKATLPNKTQNGMKIKIKLKKEEINQTMQKKKFQEFTFCVGYSLVIQQ